MLGLSSQNGQQVEQRMLRKDFIMDFSWHWGLGRGSHGLYNSEELERKTEGADILISDFKLSLSNTGPASTEISQTEITFLKEANCLHSF